METSPSTPHGASPQDQLIFSLEEAPAKPSVSEDTGKDSQTQGAISPSHLSDLLNSLDPGGCYGKMSQESFLPMEEMTSDASSVRWLPLGIGSPGGCLMLKAPEHLGLSRKEGAGCILSQVLLDGKQLQKYYLSPKACLGILTRASRKGKQLPPLLKTALEKQAQG